MSVRPDGRAAISTVVDEIGIEVGVCADWRLKTAYTPIFARQEGALQPIAVQAALAPFELGARVDWNSLEAGLDRRAVSTAGVALALRNLQHTGWPELQLVVEVDFGASVSTPIIRAAARLLSREIARNGLRPADVHVDATSLAGADEDTMLVACAALRERGVGIAWRERGYGLPAGCFPDLVVIDAGWFEAVARRAATAQLFGALVRGYRSNDVTVLVEGIGSSDQLAVALESGADWFSGPFLAPCALAGAIFPDQPLDIEAMLQRGQVVPLFG